MATRLTAKTVAEEARSAVSKDGAKNSSFLSIQLTRAPRFEAGRPRG